MLPGAMVLLSTPQGDIVFGYGTNELGAATLPRASTHFRAASNTKTMTAASMVQMVQEGKLRFDDPISKYVDGVPAGDEISIRELLTMRSGLFNFTNAPELAENLEERSRQGVDRRRSARHGVQAASRLRSGCGIRIQQHQLLPARPRRREDRRQAARRHLPGPAVRAARDEEHGAAGAHVERHSRAVCPRLHDGGPAYALADAPYPAYLVAAAKAGTLKPEDETWQNPSAYFAAGGVISTADDLATWMRALVGGKVLNADFQKQWLASPEAPVPGEDAMQKYGYGILTLSWGDMIYYHEGEMPGYQSFMGHDAENDVTLVIWTTLTLDLKGVATANTLMVKVLDEIYATSPLGYAAK